MNIKEDFTMDLGFEEMTNQAALRRKTWQVLDHQTDVNATIAAISPIHIDLERICLNEGFLRVVLYVFSLGKIYGIRQERARRAKRRDYIKAKGALKRE